MCKSLKMRIAPRPKCDRHLCELCFQNVHCSLSKVEIIIILRSAEKKCVIKITKSLKMCLPLPKMHKERTFMRLVLRLRDIHQGAESLQKTPQALSIQTDKSGWLFWK